MFEEKQLREFDKWGVPRPTSDSHGSAEEIRSNLKQAKTTNWRLEGNVLKADSDFGPIVQTVPTDLICLGSDDDGLPIFRKIVL